MITFAKLFVSSSLLFLTISLSSEAWAGNDRGVEYTLTSARLSPKQFTKGYQAEKKSYLSEHNHSTRRMLRKRHGSWIQRLLSRKHNNRTY